MRGKPIFPMLILLITLCPFSAATSAELGEAYLNGNWVIGPVEQKCGAADSEYFVFKDNGTFEAGRSGKAEAVGFWTVEADVLKLEFLSSPGFFQDIHEELKWLESKFDRFSVKVVTYNVEADRFEGVGILGDQIQKGIAVRCK